MCGSQNHNHNGATGVALELDLMQDATAAAARNRARLDQHGITCLNLMSSPGSGKTALLERTLAELRGRVGVAVIEGDMTTELDAERLRTYGVPVVAITTGRACHLDADLVASGIDSLAAEVQLDALDLLIIENVGNLVCPAEFPLGEHTRAVLVSVTEGEDKPLKYPLMFYEADCVVLTKTDLLPFLRLRIEQLVANIQQIRPGIPIFALSAENGEGLEPWIAWLLARCDKPVVEG